MQEGNLQKRFENDFTLLDLIKLFSENIRKILIISLAVGLITAFFVFFIIDPVFLSVGSIKSATKASGIGSIIGAGLPELGELGDFTGAAGSSSKELALYENILISRRCIEETIIKFNLLEEWEMKYMQDAIRHFRIDVLEIKKDKVAGTMEIGVYDKIPERAKEIGEFLIYQLNKINTELNIQNAKNNRQFIEERYTLVKKQLTNAEDSLKQYQNEFGVAPDIYVKAAAQSEMSLEVEIKSEQIKLELLEGVLSSDEAEVKTQREKISLLQNQLADIRNSSDKTSNLNLKGAPELLLNYFRLQRDVEIQNKILTYIITILEQAKIEEKKETPTVLILDNPSLPEKKVKPKRLTLTLLSIFITMIICFGYFVLRTKYKDYKNSPVN